MATVWQIRSDIENRVTNAKKSDDSELTKENIIYRMNIVRAILFRKYYEEANIIEVHPDWLTELECVVATAHSSDCSCGPCSKYQIDLPANVMNLPGDGGIVSVTLCGNRLDPIEFRRALPGQMILYRKLRFGKPSYSKPYFYRVGKRLYLLAGERLLDKCRFTILAVLDTPIDASCDPAFEQSTEYPIPNDLIEPLSQMVTKSFLGQLELDQDKANDGEQK